MPYTKQCIITTQIISTDKLSMRNKYERQHMTQCWHDSYSPQWSRQAVITVSRSTWMTTKIKWSRHQSFLYGCDRSPGRHILKPGIEIPNLRTCISGDRSHPYRKDRWRLHFYFRGHPSRSGKPLWQFGDSTGEYESQANIESYVVFHICFACLIYLLRLFMSL